MRRKIKIWSIIGVVTVIVIYLIISVVSPLSHKTHKRIIEEIVPVPEQEEGVAEEEEPAVPNQTNEVETEEEQEDETIIVATTNDKEKHVRGYWPERKSETVNDGFEDLIDSFAFQLENSREVYGLSYLKRQVPFDTTCRRDIENGSPACVYSFSDKDPVGEMQAIWDLGGRFLLKDEGVVLGDVGASLGPEIMNDKHKAADKLVLEVNDVGEALLDDYCDAMGILPGRLQIILPGKLWVAIHQTLFKVAVVDNKLGVNTIFKQGKEINWRLKSFKGSCSIIIQKSDLE